jgi:MerR family transcriptional regulator, copper efflux regulator
MVGAMGELLRIGELADRAGVTTRTVDFYTGLGLLSPAERTAGGYRLYAADTVETIGTIRRLEQHGLSLDEIAAALREDSSTDLTGLLTRLDSDLAALRTAVEAAGPDAHALLAVLGARAHALIAAAIELAHTAPL